MLSREQSPFPMSEPVLRAIAVGTMVFAAVAAVVVADWWRRCRAERLDLDLREIEGTVIFFTDEACARCGAVRRLLEDLGVAYVEVRHEGARLEAIGVDAVPLVAVRDDEGEVVAQIGGVPSKGRLRRALGRR